MLLTTVMVSVVVVMLMALILIIMINNNVVKTFHSCGYSALAVQILCFDKTQLFVFLKNRY